MRAGIRILAGVLLVAGCQSQTPSASPSPSASESPSVSPSAQPSATDPGPPAWSETGSFNDPGGFSLVIDITEGDSGVVAVGAQYEAPLPNLGPPPPHEGRVWLSADGIQWQDATPAGVFDGVSLNQVLAKPDGTYVAFGTGPDLMAWASPDGETWTSIASPFPVGSSIAGMDAGAQGYVALIEGAARELWFSEDASAWNAAYTLPDVFLSVGAGDEGFVAAGAGYAVASSDGQDWFTATTPPTPQGGSVYAAPVAGDWYAMETGQTASGFAAAAPTWFSANGLDWAASGTMPLTEVQADPSTTCHEFVTALHGSSPWLVATSRLSFPCSEGGFVVHGTQRASMDGTTWTDLPFAAGTVGLTGSGSAVFATRLVDGRLVLGGQSNSAATFWIGPAP